MLDAALLVGAHRVAMPPSAIAAGIMRLVQDSQIGLDDSIREYLDDAPESWSGITIRLLLTHTSGLARNPPGFDPSRSDPMPS